MNIVQFVLDTAAAALSLGSIAIALAWGRVAQRATDQWTAAERKFQSACRDLNEIEQILAGALGYPKYGDPRTDGTVDPDPPGNPEDYVIGEHTAASLAVEAARLIGWARLKQQERPIDG